MDATDVTVFIVDDDPSVRKSLMRLIRSAGWNAEAFASGGEFLAGMPFRGNGCLILDLTLPDLSGLEVCEQMAAQGRSLPTIFLTGGDEFTLRVRVAASAAVDFVDFLTKPVDCETLFKDVQLALDRASRPAN